MGVREEMGEGRGYGWDEYRARVRGSLGKRALTYVRFLLSPHAYSDGWALLDREHCG